MYVCIYVCIVCMKNSIEPNELDKLKYSKSLKQTTSYAHWNVILYLHAQLKYLFILFEIRKKTKLNELNELEYSKTPSQMSSSAHPCFLIYACLNMYQNIFYLLHLE